MTSDRETFLALLDFFGDVQTVFDEYPALSGPNVHRTAGRIWDAYKECRSKIDPDWDADQFERLS